MKKILICIILLIIPISINFIGNKIDECKSIEDSYINSLKIDENINTNEYIDTNSIIDVISNAISNSLDRFKCYINSYSNITYAAIFAILFDTIITFIAISLNILFKCIKQIKYKYKMDKIFDSIRE